MNTISPGDTTLRQPGRPRSFDRNDVLGAAVLVFWEKGYDGTSIGELTQSMGISRPSLYAAFGNKRDLFLQVIDRYAATHGRRAFAAFRLEPDNRRAVERFFETSIDCALDPGTPRGCLINTVAVEEAENDAELRDKLCHMFARTDAAIAGRLEANGDAERSSISDPDALARMTHSVTHSIMTRARAGASHDELAQIADDFMAVLFPQPRNSVTEHSP